MSNLKTILLINFQVFNNLKNYATFNFLEIYIPVVVVLCCYCTITLIIRDIENIVCLSDELKYLLDLHKLQKLIIDFSNIAHAFNCLPYWYSNIYWPSLTLSYTFSAFKKTIGLARPTIKSDFKCSFQQSSKNFQSNVKEIFSSAAFFMMNWKFWMCRRNYNWMLRKNLTVLLTQIENIQFSDSN